MQRKTSNVKGKVKKNKLSSSVDFNSNKNNLELEQIKSFKTIKNKNRRIKNASIDFSKLNLNKKKESKPTNNIFTIDTKKQSFISKKKVIKKNDSQCGSSMSTFLTSIKSTKKIEKPKTETKKEKSNTSKKITKRNSKINEFIIAENSQFVESSFLNTNLAEIQKTEDEETVMVDKISFKVNKIQEFLKKNEDEKIEEKSKNNNENEANNPKREYEITLSKMENPSFLETTIINDCTIQINDLNEVRLNIIYFLLAFRIRKEK